MNVETGYFGEPSLHHDGWFKFYRFKGIVEIWFGHRWINIDWRVQ